jgi:hypothetical protein
MGDDAADGPLTCGTSERQPSRRHLRRRSALSMALSAMSSRHASARDRSALPGMDPSPRRGILAGYRGTHQLETPLTKHALEICGRRARIWLAAVTVANHYG